MSAVIMLVRRECALMLTDAASYFNNGTIYKLSDKAAALPKLRAVISVLGPTVAAKSFVAMAAESFSSFDDLVANIEARSRAWFALHSEAWALAHARSGKSPAFPRFAEAWIAGWSTARARAEGFSIYMGDATPGKCAPFTCDDTSVGGLSANPCPSRGELVAAKLMHLGRGANSLGPNDLLHLMEAQRRHRLLEAQIFAVGGWATLTTVTATGVRQERLQTWAEDRPGELIRPAPIDWAAWRAAREGATAPSPLQRARAAKKAAKAGKVAMRAARGQAQAPMH